MRLIYRNKDNYSYWQERWSSSGSDGLSGFTNPNIYPIKFAQRFLNKNLKILEAGVGAGRLYFHFDNRGEDIEGFDFSVNAINAITSVMPDARVSVQDIRNLQYKSDEFDVILSFGVLHNFELLDDMKKSISECHRVLKKGGQMMFSVRCDNLENDLIEWIVRSRLSKSSERMTQFHRAHFHLRDLEDLFSEKFDVKQVEYVRNVSFLFKFKVFRKKRYVEKNFNEQLARAQGFELNAIGAAIDWFLRALFIKNFSNLILVTVVKK